MIEAAKARYCKHSQTIKNFNHKCDSFSDGSCVLVFDYLQRVHTAPCVGWELLSGWFEGIKNLNDILHYVPIFVSDPLLLCVWRVTSYQGDKDLKKRFSDNLRRRTDSIEDFENFTVAASLTTDTKTTSFNIERKEAVFICLQHCIASNSSKTLQIRE